MSILPAEDDDARCGLFGQPAIVSGLIVADQRFVIHATEFLEISERFPLMAETSAISDSIRRYGG